MLQSHIAKVEYKNLVVIFPFKTTGYFIRKQTLLSTSLKKRSKIFLHLFAGNQAKPVKIFRIELCIMWGY